MTDTRQLKAGIIGAGLMGRWHAHYARKAGVGISAIIDSDLGAAMRLAKRFGAESHATSLAEICPETMDAVHICTPLATHETLVTSALEQGLHVIVEKPLAIDTGSTEHLFTVAKNSDRLLCPVHQFAFQRGVTRLVDGIECLGEVRHIELVFCSAGGVGKPARELDIIVADILPHAVSLMQILCGEFSSRCAWSTYHTNPGELLATTTAGGTTVCLTVSMSARPTNTSMTVYGDRKTAHLDLFHGFSYTEPGKVSRFRKVIRPFEQSVLRLFAASVNLGGRFVRNEPAYPGLRPLIDQFYDAVKGKQPPPVSAETAVEAARIRDTLIGAAHLGES